MSRARDLADGTFSGAFSADSPTLVVDDANNNVGIGTTSPSSYNANVDDLVVSNAASGGITIATGTTSQGAVAFADGTSGGSPVMGRIRYDHSVNEMDFRVNNSEAARIDSSKNLLVGKTATASVASDVPGHTLYASGTARHIVSGGEVMNVIRQTNDGTIIGLYKDATAVGKLGYISTGFYIDGETNHSGWRFGNGGIVPFRNGADSDNTTDLGSSSTRMDDIYATNPTIQTSDANLKQQIASLTDAEITAAKAISKLFKTFKWNDKVAEKGDAARTHTGVIAQEVEQAMTDAGLDAGNYAFFIRGVWWEADETYTDDDGVEQTITNTYDTLEEAPAGATERTRLGIRYPELLAFIGAATEQRLASIEARLDALEAV